MLREKEREEGMFYFFDDVDVAAAEWKRGGEGRREQTGCTEIWTGDRWR